MNCWRLSCMCQCLLVHQECRQTACIWRIEQLLNKEEEMIIKKRKVIVINNALLNPESQKVLMANTRIPVVIDRTIDHGFEVKEVE